MGHDRPGDPGFDASSEVIVALDVGGTKLEGGVVSSSGEALSRKRVLTPVDDGTPDASEALFECVVELLCEVIAQADVIVAAGEGAGTVGADSTRPAGMRIGSIGVGCGGPMAPPNVSPLNITQWRDFPLAERLEDEFGVPVRVDNDAKALALAEGIHGAAVGVDDFLAMVVSTGVGGGIVLDGRLLDGGGGNAGHIGHIVVDPQGRRCPCGARGCLEAQVSGTAIAEITGAPAQEADIAVRRWAGRLVGRAVGSVCNLLDLRLAVLAGSVAIGFGAPFLESAQSELDRVAKLDHSVGARLRIGALGADGPLLGAACVGRLAVAPTAVGTP